MAKRQKAAPAAPGLLRAPIERPADVQGQAPPVAPGAAPGQALSGMAPAEYNEAVRLQCAVRDWTKYPVSMLQAFKIARGIFESAPGLLPGALEKIRVSLELEEEEEERARLAEQARISANAGKT